MNAKGNPFDLPVMTFQCAQDFVAGQVLLIDKPLHWTSFDVVNKVRGAVKGKIREELGLKKIKVGHAGTLDPLASGVLILCTGKMTKRIDELQAQAKSYKATIRLGAQTPCLDAELAVEHWHDASHLTLEDIRKAAEQWTGDMGQIPPAYSAKKVDGQKAYAVARKGGELNLRPTYITVSRFAVLSATHLIVEDQATKHAVCDVEVEIDCTKGTYIRALARDLGKTLAVGGYLTALRRTSSGPFSEDSLLSVEEIVRRVKEA